MILFTVNTYTAIVAARDDHKRRLPTVVECS